MTINRERKVDVEKLSPSQVDEIAEQVGKKIQGILLKTNEEVNALLKTYGIETKVVMMAPWVIGQDPTNVGVEIKD